MIVDGKVCAADGYRGDGEFAVAGVSLMNLPVRGVLDLLVPEGELGSVGGNRVLDADRRTVSVGWAENPRK